MTVQNSTFNDILNHFEIVADFLGDNLVVKVLDAHGRIAKTIKQNFSERVDKVRLNMDGLRRGKYTINIFTDDHFIKAVHFTKV